MFLSVLTGFILAHFIYFTSDFFVLSIYRMMYCALLVVSYVQFMASRVCEYFNL